MRLRLPELFQEARLTPYEFAKLSDGRVSLSAAYRVVRMKGRLATFDGDLLEALCDVLGVGLDDLFERERPRRGKARP